MHFFAFLLYKKKKKKKKKKLTPILRQKTHILRVNWREVEFAAIYTSKVLTIDTREIARDRA